MFKTGLKIFIVVASIAAIVLGYYYFFQRNKNVPDAYGIFINDGPLLRVNKPIKFWDALDRNGFLKEMDSSWQKTFGTLQFVKKKAAVKNIYISPQTIENKVSLAFIIENYSTSNAYRVMDYLHDSIFNAQKIVQKDKSGLDYFAVYDKDAPILFYANLDGIVVLTFSDSVMLEMLNKIADNKPVKHGKLFNTANDKVAANLFFDRTGAAKKGSSFAFKMLQNPYSQADQYVFDLYLKDGALLMSGLSEPLSGSMEEEIAKASSRTFELADIIPEKVQILYQLSADGLVTQFDRKELITDKQNLWISSFTVDEYSFFKSGKLYGIGIKSKGKSSAFEALKSYEQILGKSLDFQTYRFDKEISFKIAKSDFNWLKGLMPGFFNSKQELSYAVAAGDYLVFANRLDEIKNICKNSVLNRNLKASYRFEQHKTNFQVLQIHCFIVNLIRMCFKNY